MGSDNCRPKVGVIGLGLMGSALADALIDKGFDVTVWNRTRAKTERFAKAGAKLATTPAELASSVEVLVVNLFDEAAVKDVVITDAMGAAMRGKTLIDLTSAGGDLATLTAWCGANQVSLLKGDILTYPDDIREGTGTICYGGERKVYDAVLPVLDAMGGRPVHVAEDPDAQQQMVSAYYCFIYPALLGFILGAAVLHRAGVDPGPFAERLILRGMKDAPWIGIFEGTARAVTQRRYDTNLQAALDTWNDGLAGLVASIEADGVDANLLRAVKTILDGAAASGFGQVDIASTLETMVGKARGAA